jgi:hypothetical protein
MHMEIKKYPISTDGVLTRISPDEGKDLIPFKVAFQSQDGGFVNESMQVWCIEVDDGSEEEVVLFTAATGVQIPSKVAPYVNVDYYLGTAIHSTGELVFHIFDVSEAGL